MAQLNVTINGRNYRMACEDGQEEHLMGLAQDIDSRIEQLRGNFGEVGDARLTVMAALMVADELSEAGKKIRKLEEDLAASHGAQAAAAERAQETQAAIIAALNAAAERIEGVTRQLNQTIGNGSGIAVGG